MAIPTNDNPHPPHVSVAEPQEPEFSRAVRQSKHPIVTVLSMLIPGAGHMVKGHRNMGIVLLLGAIFVLGWSVLLGTGTYGLGLLLIPVYWIAVALHGFSLRPVEHPVVKK